MKAAQQTRPKLKKVFWFFFSKKNLLLVFLVIAVPAFAQMVTRDGLSLTATQEARAESIGDQLRCLVCQNESIEGSSASLAKQLRVIIREQVVAGASRRDILDYMVRRYGIFVLLKPPLMPLTWALYASPILALLAGALAAWAGRRADLRPAPPLDEAERARLETLLKP